MKKVAGMHALDSWVAGASLGGTSAVLYAACALAYALAPGGTMQFFRLLFHSAVPLSPVVMTAESFVYGLLAAFAAAFAAGWVFAKIYNSCLGHCNYKT